MAVGRQSVEAAVALRSTVFFERMLRPHRSLPPRGFHVLIILLGAVSLAVGVGFVSVGAWPVVGFFGLDAALLCLAFRLSYRSAQQSEALRLAGADFTVERVGIRGERQSWRFPAFWLRVVLDDAGGPASRLVIGSHGRQLAIGGFLPPAARRELATALRAALVRWRTALNPAGGAPSI